MVREAIRCGFSSKNSWLHDKTSKRRTWIMWPFPTPAGPTPWTRKQIKEYARQQRDQAGEAPFWAITLTAHLIQRNKHLTHNQKSTLQKKHGQEKRKLAGNVKKINQLLAVIKKLHQTFINLFAKIVVNKIYKKRKMRHEIRCTSRCQSTANCVST